MREIAASNGHDPLIGPGEAAGVLGIETPRNRPLDRLFAIGELPVAVRVGACGRRRFRLSDVLALKAAGESRSWPAL